MSVALSLFKFRYHLSFAGVVVGALLFAHRIDGVLLGQLGVLYVTFNVLLYGGIYILNDVADRHADGAHPGKRRRAVASGRLTVRAAVVGAAALIAIAMLSAALLFPAPIVGAFWAALALNAAYSCGGRNLPYVDVALNGAPHSVRFLLGVLLVGRTPPVEHLAAWFCLAAGIACVRRLIELDAGGRCARPTLRAYSRRGLLAATTAGLVALCVCAVLDGLVSPGFYSIVLPGYILLVMLGARTAGGQAVGAWLWLR